MLNHRLNLFPDINITACIGSLNDESYPIEVAWAERFNPKRCDSFLIRPAAGWTYWDSYAEECIHGISRNMLEREGVSVNEAVDRLFHALAGDGWPPKRTDFSGYSQKDLDKVARQLNERPRKN